MNASCEVCVLVHTETMGAGTKIRRKNKGGRGVLYVRRGLLRIVVAPRVIREDPRKAFTSRVCNEHSIVGGRFGTRISVCNTRGKTCVFFRVCVCLCLFLSIVFRCGCDGMVSVETRFDGSTLETGVGDRKFPRKFPLEISEKCYIYRGYRVELRWSGVNGLFLGRGRRRPKHALGKAGREG